MIYVDPRIGSGEMLKAIKSRVGGKAQLLELPSADFCFEGNGPDGKMVTVGIERKAIGDMLSSMRSGRYAGFQLPNMSRDYDLCYLVVEGLFKPDKDGTLLGWARSGWGPLQTGRQHFMYAELDRHLCSLELRKNVMVVRSSSQLETIWQVVNRYIWWQREWEEHSSADAIKTQQAITFTRVTLLRKIAAELPGVGWKKSKAVEKYFGTVEKMVNALPTEWQEIEGIGKTMAVRLYGALRGKE